MPADGAARVRFLFHCWLLLIAAAALCDKAAAQGSACGKLDPGQVDPIPDANFRSETTVNFLTLDWLPPDYDSQYYYIVTCPTCPTKQANTTDETYTFLDLTAATEYSFTIQAGRWNCRLSTPFYLSGKTFLTRIPGPVHISDVTHTSFRAHWAASPDAEVQYEVNGALTVQSKNYVFRGQKSGARVEVAVRPVKTGFGKGARIFGTAFTKLFAIDVNSVKVSASETAISVAWRPSITSGVFYQLTCTRVGSGDVTNVTSSSPSATCSSLHSGEAYRLSVAVKKESGFEDAVTQLPNQLTKLFAIDANRALFIVRETSIDLSWEASATEGVKYQVTCRRVSTGDAVVMPESTSLNVTFASLHSGEAYKLSVAVTKPGFEEAVTWLPTQLTKLFAIDASSARFNGTETAISVSWRASSTAGVSYQLTCIQVGSGDVTGIASSSPSATCGSLQSGEAYNLSVTVKKEGGFDEAVTWLPTQLTKNRGRCPSEDWLQFSGFCYLLVKGPNGRTLTEAVSDCQRRDSSAHLLWITTQAEMDWVTDYSARKWRLREDYRAQCKNCRFQGDAAWTGLYRDEADGGKFKWLKDNSAVNVSVNWLIGPSQPPMNFGYLLDDSRELLWRTYQPEARQFHFCKAPMRDQQQSLRSDAALEAARENSAKSTSRCPSPAWTLLYRGHNNQLCFLRTYPGSFHRALKECRRWAPNSEMLPIRTLWRQLDRPVRYYHICRFGLLRVKSAIHLEMRRTAGQAMHLGASCLHCQNGLLLSSLLSGLLLQLMRLLPAG